MCGIAGIINLNGRPVAESDLRKMTDTIRHRGPDGDGFYTGENVGFGHRRLAIIDLSDAGKQPMQYMGCTITFNGEIYNFLELRQELQKKGYGFYTATDTEVLLAAYKHWGADCVNHLNGMWAFAIHDAANGKLFCSRDRFGEKPFYYCERDNRIVFGSEIRAVRAALTSHPEPNEIMMARFLVFEQAEHFRETFFHEIVKLPAAHNLEINLQNGAIKIAQYYSPRRVNTWCEISEQDAVEELRTRLRKSVALRLRSDVEVGTCLSGGLDSSSIAALAASLYNSDLQASFTGITAGSHDAKKDETQYAKKVAETLGMTWKHCNPDAEEYEQAFARALEIQEEPFDSPSVIMQHFVMRLAQESGLKVLLDGQGADELLLGYKQHLAWAIQSLPMAPAAKLAWQSLDKYQIGLKDLLLLVFYHTHTGRKRSRQLSKWPGLRKDLQDQLQEDALAESRLPADLFSKQYYELSHRILPMLLRYEDKNAMAYSVETRLPFLDPDLVEFVLNLSMLLKVKGGWSKYGLRKGMEGLLPPEIIWRRGKVGFEVGSSITEKMVGILKIEHLYKNNFYQSSMHSKEFVSSNLGFRIACNAKWMHMLEK
jgi:asparagine synthase (glutamine-hydrolysing)